MLPTKLGVLPLLLVVGCGVSRPASPPASAPAAATESAAPAPSATSQPVARAGCPDLAPETRVGAEDVHRGAALVFTTPDDVGDLRGRVSSFELPQAEPPRLDNIHHGVRLVFETDKDSDVGNLRRRVAERARELAIGCGIVLGVHTTEAAPETGYATAPPTPAKASPTKHTPAHKAKKAETSKKKAAAKPDKSKPKTSAPAKAPPPAHDGIRPAPKPSLPKLPGAPPSPLDPKKPH